MKRGICPIAVLYVAFNVLSLTLSVHILPESYIVTVLGHMTSHDKTRSGRFPIGGLLTPSLYLTRFPRY